MMNSLIRGAAGDSTRSLSILLALVVALLTPVAGAFAPDSNSMPAGKSGLVPHTATVEETMNSAGYTYVRVKENDKTYWIAVPEMELEKGETISFYEHMMMEQFTSKTLQRTFDRILFVSAIARGDRLPEVPSSAPDSRPVVMENAPVRELGETAGRLTVAEVYAQAQEFAGKTIEVKGKVVKISHGIMDRNWVHLQDGTGEGATSKIVFRTVQEGLAVGEEVVAKGILELNKNFGFSYFYPVIVEDAVFRR